ncbi:CobW family GTP-binding protein [uncultured Methylobacterium sp.]|uniref:CobW family GTP-binding protein n=1 Tax=uncultured Methylobacterium sp. TaxID=157278 RepID=UPI0035CBDF3A
MTAVTVDVLAGFLGAGKTSLLRRLFAANVLSNTALLVNEFADTALDLRLLGVDGALAEPFVQGCLCCAVDGDLRGGLLELLAKRASGAVPPFERVIVETSGLADPAGLLATISNDLMLRHRFRPGFTVTLVDAVNVLETLAAEDVALSQVVIADRVILSKGDLGDPKARASIVSAVRALNPLADVSGLYASQWVNDPWAELSPRRVGRFRASAAAPDGTQRHAVSALKLERRLPVEWASLAVWLSALAHRHGHRILRMKGFAVLPNGRRVVIQGVRHLIFSPEHLPDAFACAGLELVLIMRDLDASAVRRSFDVFVEDLRMDASDAVSGTRPDPADSRSELAS